MSLEKEHPKEKFNTTTLLMLLVALASFYGGDAVGYHDGDPIKLFTGEVWPLLLGSGHSVSATACFLAAFKLCDLLVWEKPLNPKIEAIAAGVISMIIELSGQLMNTVTDQKDVVTILVFIMLYYFTNETVEQVFSHIAAYLDVEPATATSSAE